MTKLFGIVTIAETVTAVAHAVTAVAGAVQAVAEARHVLLHPDDEDEDIEDAEEVEG